MDVEVDAGSYELLHKQGDVEVVGVVTRKVAAFKLVRQLGGPFLEGGLVSHIGVRNAVHSRGFS